MSILTVACFSAKNEVAVPSASPQATSTAPSVEDPKFLPWPGAKAYYGYFGGGAYEFEVPDNWTGGVVFFLHGSHEATPTLYVEQPPLRGYLIRHGYAWAASSYDRNDYIIGGAADQTAALWDLFREKVGNPTTSYVLGSSMGGGAVVASAERYRGLYAGALAFCGTDGRLAVYDVYGDAWRPRPMPPE